MINTTFYSLSIASLLSTSPFYTLYSTHQGLLRSSFFNSRFTHFYSSVIYSETNWHKTLISNTIFTKVQNSAIFLVDTKLCLFVLPDKDNKLFELGDIIKGQKITSEQYNDYADEKKENLRPYFQKNKLGQSLCGNITITECIFDGCFAQTFHGGSIHIEQDCFVIIHSTIFNNSYTGRRFGGAGVICKQITDENSDFKTEQLQSLDVRYCCFQDCYGKGEDVKITDDEYNRNQLYGVALFIASVNTTLFYAATVNCPGSKYKAAGAQFDMNAQNVYSHSVNATGGNSKFCGGIEYRSATDGFFKFQTISDMTCMFAISYTDIGEAKLDLSVSNVFKIELIKEPDNDNYLHPGLIHVRRTKENSNDYDFRIQNFTFFNNIINDNSRIVSRGAVWNTYQKIRIILENCHYDCGDDKVAITEGMDGYLFLKDCNIGKLIPNSVEQLSLGDCAGAATPAPLTPISPSEEFSKSYAFTKSNNFDPSSVFSLSDSFTIQNDPPGDGSKSNNKNKTGMIAGVSVAAVAGVAAIAGVAVFFIRRNHVELSDVNIETLDDETRSVNNANPIYDNNAEADPFKEDFN